MRRIARLACVLLCAGALLGMLAACDASTKEPDPTTTPDPVERFRSPAWFDSYRYSVYIEASTDLMDLADVPSGLDVDDTLLVYEIEGVRINPDREYSLSQSSFGPLHLERETIVVGDALWSRQAGGAWRQRAVLAGPEDLVGQDVLMSPSTIFGDDPEMLRRVTIDLEARPNSPSTIDGRPARHWVLDRSWLDTYQGDFSGLAPALTWPETIEIHIWADVEWRVATRLLVIAGTPTNAEALRFEMRIFDVNGDDISIEVPNGAIGR